MLLCEITPIISLREKKENQHDDENEVNNQCVIIIIYRNVTKLNLIE
jgi:hypothetical protein